MENLTNISDENALLLKGVAPKGCCSLRAMLPKGNGPSLTRGLDSRPKDGYQACRTILGQFAKFHQFYCFVEQLFMQKLGFPGSAREIL